MYLASHETEMPLFEGLVAGWSSASRKQHGPSNLTDWRYFAWNAFWTVIELNGLVTS